MKELYTLIFRDVLSEKFSYPSSVVESSTRVFYLKRIINECWYRKIHQIIHIPYFRCCSYIIHCVIPYNDDEIKRIILSRLCMYKCMNNFIKDFLSNDSTILKNGTIITQNVTIYRLMMSSCMGMNFKMFHLLLNYCDDKQGCLRQLFLVICINGYDTQLLEYFITNEKILKITNFQDIIPRISIMKRSDNKRTTENCQKSLDILKKYNLK